MGAQGGKTGRRPGDNDTRRQILDAARALFASEGFRSATFRAIAHEAGVDQALIRHYFGDKATLFRAALVIPDGVTSRLIDALEGPESASTAVRLTAAYLGLWEDPDSREQMIAIARSALSNEDAMTHLRSVLEHVLQDAATHGVTADPVRITLAMSHLMGVAYARHLTRADAVRDLPFDDLVAMVAPAVQLHLDTPAIH